MQPSSGTVICFGRFFHSLIFAIPAWPFENKGSFYHPFWVIFKSIFCMELKLHAKACPSNAVKQTRVKNLSLPAFHFMVQCNGNPCQKPLNPEGAHFTLSHRSILWFQELVIFPFRSQINSFPSKFVKGFFCTISLLCHTWTPLLDCPVQGHEQNPFSHLVNFEEQPMAMAEKKWTNFPTSYFKKDMVFWPS